MASPNDPTPTSTQHLDQITPEQQRALSLYQNSALALFFVCPAIALLPPRRLNPTNVALGGLWFYSANVVTETYTGRSLVWHIGSRVPSDRNRLRKAEERWKAAEALGNVHEAREAKVKLDELRARMRDKVAKRGVLGRAFMGDAGVDWVEERNRREEKALESGKGYSGLIVDYIREALTGVKPDDDDDEEEEGD